MNKRSIGKEKELLAAKFLEDKGYKIVAQNYFCRLGELDLIAKKDNCLIFVEVKYRKNSNFGNPLEAVGIKKQNTIRKCAQFFMLENHMNFAINIRFDVIGILGNEIMHIENAF